MIIKLTALLLRLC